jgi:hypothetical protein
VSCSERGKANLINRLLPAVKVGNANPTNSSSAVICAKDYLKNSCPTVTVGKENPMNSCPAMMGGKANPENSLSAVIGGKDNQP